MAKPYGSPSSSSSPSSKTLSKEAFPKLLESLEDRGVELKIILSIQPFSSHPPPTSDIGSLADIGPESLENPVQTPESSLTTDGQLGLAIYPLNPLVALVVISLQHWYSSCHQPGVPLELSRHTSSVVRCHLFPAMEPKGEALVTSLDQSEVSTPHTIEEDNFLLKSFPTQGEFPLVCIEIFHPFI